MLLLEAASRSIWHSKTNLQARLGDKIFIETIPILRNATTAVMKPRCGTAAAVHPSISEIM